VKMKSSNLFIIPFRNTELDLVLFAFANLCSCYRLNILKKFYNVIKRQDSTADRMGFSFTVYSAMCIEQHLHTM